MPRFVFFILQPVIFNIGWIGLVLWVALPYEAFNMDGEWMEEHSPTAMSLGCWIAASILIAVRSLAKEVGPVLVIDK